MGGARAGGKTVAVPEGSAWKQSRLRRMLLPQNEVDLPLAAVGNGIIHCTPVTSFLHSLSMTSSDFSPLASLCCRAPLRFSKEKGDFTDCVMDG